MPDIYQYLDYRAFLGDYFAEQKKSLPQFSHEYFARRANIKSKGFVLHVIKGQRNLTRTVLLNIARAMDLDQEQTAYFEELVAFNQAGKQREREFYLARITQKRKLVTQRPLENRQYEFYSAWYHSVIRELITLTGGIANLPKLAKLLVPPATVKQVKESLQLQKELGILSTDEEGNLTQADPFISGGGTVRTTALVQYQKEMLALAQDAWDNFAKDEISMHTLTLCVSEKMFSTMREEIRLFKDRMLKLAGSEQKTPERVFHVNINVFPVSKTVKEKQQ